MSSFLVVREVMMFLSKMGARHRRRATARRLGSGRWMVQRCGQAGVPLFRHLKNMILFVNLNIMTIRVIF
jgi:hypothetical protein